MKKLYIGDGFFIGIFFVAMAPLMALLMAWYAFDQKLWIAGLFAAGMIWFFVSNLREFVLWFSIPPQKYLDLSEVALGTRDVLKPLAELRQIHLGVLRTQKKVNFVNAGYDLTAIVKFVFNDGSQFKIRAGQGPFTTFAPFGRNLGEKEVASLLSIVRLISSNSNVPPRQMELQDLVK